MSLNSVYLMYGSCVATTVSLPNAYVEARTPSVGIFGGGDYTEVITVK